MEVNRRQFLAATSAGLLSCACTRSLDAGTSGRLDLLLSAHAGRWPEREGAGANHYPMAAEVLEAFGYEEEIDDAWIEGASLYGSLSPESSVMDSGDARLGDYGGFNLWLERFRRELAERPWQKVIKTWAPTLAPGISAATFHGVIRTGHAVRALALQRTPARLEELAAGLAFWAARYVELPSGGGIADFSELEHPWLNQAEDVPFHDVMARMTERPLVSVIPIEGDPRIALDAVVREGAIAFLEMLVAERHRIWNLHTVTGPAAVEWLFPHVDRRSAERLVSFARQATLATLASFGEPYQSRAHERKDLEDWPTYIERAVASRSVHGIKLIDALVRFDRDDDPIWRSVAAQWFEWV